MQEREGVGVGEERMRWERSGLGLIPLVWKELLKQHGNWTSLVSGIFCHCACARVHLCVCACAFACVCARVHLCVCACVMHVFSIISACKRSSGDL